MQRRQFLGIAGAAALSRVDGFFRLITWENGTKLIKIAS